MQAGTTHVNRLKRLWQEGRPTFGVLVTMPSVPLVQLLARAGFDWLLIDLEHSPIDIATAHAMIAATAGTPTVPLARIAWNVPWLAKPLLDAGALGITVPMIRSRADAERAVAAVRYPRAGTGERMWGPFYAPARWGLSMPGYMQMANEEILSIVTIEHPDAVRKIDEIVTTPGLDLAIVGIYDLSTAMGLPGQLDHPEVLAAAKEAEAAILRSSVAAGGVASSAEQANRMAEMGYRFIALGFDWMLIQRAAERVLDGIHR